ncbi:DEAD/DEAH box helicase [Lacticaseibacillus paracasei]|uniref:DEAD/DEAH box helicase n=1 Tax=Lacticaseibacillus paracasei TaxID=1597 RepID=UPI001377749D|nr:DEAD/DEAH box helicase [Lacticaseibacillus paracasei]MCZ2769361.1 DEAD/DEAH box helicase [Lacticaseibacillus paracasei]MCZ2774909.1 DEAD/DEAH box helicase [Lacticaseibacillus paracasei]MCZ2777792.1 DEAD/DEAH box helicase [Lacticaseibacillus paracasei]MCZ2783972.1 DEAD/DEAH box helicase [Lacticaseibacillus paracasei]NCU14403.1 DEAD/DEAH box helicase [Lacticaseibacillus paracasei]
MKFKELGLDHDLLKAIAQSGFEEATPIQAETIPLVLAGKDVIGQAQTGTGKTAAFGLPILQNIDKADRSIQALVISPTRELAIQTQEELYRLGQDKKIKVQAVYGGADIRRQIRQLSEHPQIVVGTPGRILDHIGRHTLKLQNLKVLVLDEADEMLDMGFIDDIEKIVEQMPTARQTLLFSATIPASIMRLNNKFMHEPVTVKIKAKELTADNVEQYYVRAKDYERFDVMTRLFDVQDPDLALIFGRTKRRVDELTRGLKARGYRAEGIHGDLTQQKRMSVLRQFKSGQLDFLVATDVAARGLDISGVTHVYNYDIPQDPDSYVHRIGRTGRAGHKGVSVTFVTPNEIEYLHTIEDLTKKRMLPMKPPTAEEALMGQISSGLETIKAQVEANDTEKYEAMAESLLENYTPLQLVSAYLKAVSPDDASAVPVKITPERPLPHRGRSNHGHGNNRGGYKGGYKGKRREGGYQGNRDNKRSYDKKRNFSDKRKNVKRSFKIRNGE